MISVIVPTYNRVNQLSYCLESLISTDYEDLQIIVVDDGSDDGTKDFCQEFCKRDKRVEYHRQNNHGVSAARNLGLSFAKGEWIAFCDSDDVVMPNHFNLLSSFSQYENVLLLTGSSRANMVDGKIVITDESKNEVVTRSSAVQYLFSDEYNPYKQGFFFIWNKFYNRRIINQHNIRFDESVSLDEDMLFTLRYLTEVKGIVHNKTATYLTIEWPSITHLGRKQRSPGEYIDIHSKNYSEYLRLFDSTKISTVKVFGASYAVQRTIRLAFLTQTDIADISFIKSKLIPFLKAIDTSAGLHVDRVSLLLYHILCFNLPYTAMLVAKSFNFIKKLIGNDSQLFFLWHLL